MGTSLKTLNLTLPISSIEAYVQRANQIPLLSEEQEKNLTERYAYQQDLEAARQLVMSHLRFVVKVARIYTRYGLALADLIQEGNVGLMKAVKRFNPAMGVRLVTFAVHWIKAEIQEFILRNWRIVKIATTKAQRKLFFNLRKTKQKLNWFSQEEVNAVAKDLGVKPEMVTEMESRLAGQDISFDPLQENNEENELVVVPAQYLEDHRYDPAKQYEMRDNTEQNQENLQQALATLDERSKQIVMQRWLTEPKATLHDLADHYQISAERVRQLEQNAMKKLRLALRAI